MKKTKRIIAAVTAAIITATSASIMSVFADNGEVKKADSVSATKADNTESRLQEYADDISSYMMMNSIAGDAFVHDNKVVVTYSAHEDKTKIYVKEKGIDESVIVYESGKNVVETPDEEKKSPLKETAEDINEYMRSNGISGFTYVRIIDGVEKIFISYDGFFEKIKAYVIDTGVDESLVIYQQSHDDDIISNTPDNSSNEESNLKVYAKDISDFMIRNGIAGDAFVHDNKVVVTYSSQEDEIKAYVKEKGIDENVIVYEPGKNVNETYPTNINVDYSEQYHQVRFTWDKVEGADNYGIAVYLAGKWRIQAQNITDTVYTSPKNLTSGKTYKVAVAAKVNGNWDTANAIKNAVTITIK